MSPKGRPNKENRPVIVVAGESENDRQVLHHLIRSLHPGKKIVPIRRKTVLSTAEKHLSPRVDELRRLAKTAAVGADLAGIVVHVDLDTVDEARYVKVRERITSELSKVFPCPSALALAAYETEAWLMQFPKAFSRLNSGWTLHSRYRGCDLTKVDDPKKKLMDHRWVPSYRESDAPRIMEKAFLEGELMKPDGKNRSYQEFMDELSAW
ncbi:hypothetical protein [Streptomyces xanthophaeus]|uniref:hypothetical protein n=1 Tax=Streptomyces xanthophaeus TaxID=67385 RepID=UPI0026496F12|nr:hypothetical protein [Streptomyces xanthophaeus]WKD32084.1 hypothetical protein KO717_09080 [Streptomyces xanthophaeus]